MERTGIPHVDELIEQFAAGWINGADYTWHEQRPAPDSPEYEDFEDFLPANEYARPDYGWGMCSAISAEFAKFVYEQSPETTCTVSETAGGGSGHTPEYFGYHDWEDAAAANEEMHMEDPMPLHCVVYIDEGDERYMVDFTASQYGYTEFPMVQRQGPDGWEREFEIRPDLASFSSPADLEEPCTPLPASTLDADFL